MEIRKLAIFLAMVVAVSSYTEAHSIDRRSADDDIVYDDTQADEANDDYAQNDTDGEPEEEKVQAAIVTKPATYEVNLGRTVRLECTVDSDNGTVVQWYKDGVLNFIGTIKTNLEATRYSLIPNSKDLLIKDVAAEDSGVYRCEIVQKTAAAINHTVVVMEAPKVLSLSATNGGRVPEGSEIKFTCNVAGLPPPQIIWSREVENGNQRLQEKDAEFSGNTMIIRNVNRSHSGKYYCYAFSKAGNTEAGIYITVAAKPHVTIRKPEVNSAINMEAVLECSAYGEHAAHIRWYKDGSLIEDVSSRFSVQTSGVNSNLTVTPASDSDFGTFTCEAENANGKHNRSVELTERPVIEDLESDGPRVSWSVHSHQPLEDVELQIRALDTDGEWKSYQVPLPATQSHRYVMSYDLSEQDILSGKYEVIVKVKNTKKWAGPVDAVPVDIEPQVQRIQTASVIGGTGNYAPSVRPTTTALATIFTYLLIRMF